MSGVVNSLKMKCLSVKQINQYKQDGFLLVKNVFPKNICNAYKKLLIKEIKKGKKIWEEHNNKKITHNANKIADIPRGINEGILQDIAHRNSKFMKLVKSTRLKILIGQIFGKNVKSYRLYLSTSVFKSKDVLSKTEYHQDMPFWKGKSNKFSAWISLNKVTKKSGSMCYIPGSHKKKIRKYVKIKGYGHKQKSFFKCENVDPSKRVIVETEIGDVIIHHTKIIHGSEENILKKDRFALVFTYQPGTDTSHHRNGPAVLIKKSKLLNNYI